MRIISTSFNTRSEFLITLPPVECFFFWPSSVTIPIRSSSYRIIIIIFLISTKSISIVNLNWWINISKKCHALSSSEPKKYKSKSDLQIEIEGVMNNSMLWYLGLWCWWESDDHVSMVDGSIVKQKGAQMMMKILNKSTKQDICVIMVISSWNGKGSSASSFGLLEQYSWDLRGRSIKSSEWLNRKLLLFVYQRTYHSHSHQGETLRDHDI